MTTRLLYDVGAEQSVLGALLIDNSAIDLVSEIISASDFWTEAHRVIYQQIINLIVSQRPADVATLSASLSVLGELQEAGGLQYLGELVLNVPSAANVRYYAKIVSERSTERDLVEISNKMHNLASEAGPLSERLSRAQQLIVGLTERAVSNDSRSISDTLPEFIEQLERRRNADGNTTGLSTGLIDLDRTLGGLRPGQLMILAGRPGMGKSVLALQIAQHNAVKGHASAVFSLEMKMGELTERAVVNAGRLDASVIRQGNLEHEDQWEALSAAMGKLNGAPLYFDDSAAATVPLIRAKVRRLMRKHRIELLVVDYLQLMSGEQRADNRREEVDGISRGLKLLAVELGIPIIGVAQLSRKCEERTDRRPLLSDLRESGGIEQDADIVLLLYRDEEYDAGTDAKGILEIIVAKQRMGKTGTVYAAWMGQHYLIGNLEGVYSPQPRKPRRRPTLMQGMAQC